MHRILEDVRENVSNPRGQKEKRAEIKKTDVKFTEIKKTEGNIHRTLEDSREEIYQNLRERRKMLRNLEDGKENAQKCKEQKEEIAETSRKRGEKHRNPAILSLAALSLFVAFSIVCSKVLLSIVDSCFFVGRYSKLTPFLSYNSLVLYLDIDLLHYRY
jgi:hypothetical protein